MDYGFSPPLGEFLCFTLYVYVMQVHLCLVPILPYQCKAHEVAIKSYSYWWASQTTPIKIMHVFVFFYTNCKHAILIPVRVLSVSINYCKQFKLLCFRYYPRDFPTFRMLICYLYNTNQLLQYMIIIMVCITLQNRPHNIRPC